MLDKKAWVSLRDKEDDRWIKNLMEDPLMTLLHTEAFPLRAFVNYVIKMNDRIKKLEEKKKGKKK